MPALDPSPAQMTPEQRSAERRAALKWGALVFGILGTSFTTAMIMLFVSGSDPSFAVEPDYYDQAINWNDHAAQREINKQLAWSVELTDAPSTAMGMRTLTATVRNRDGAPIEDATIGAVAFHNARSGDRFAFSMTPDGAGAYTAEQPLKRAGYWEFRFTIVTPDTTFTTITTEDLDKLPASGSVR